MICDVNWGRCDKLFSDGQLSACPIPPTHFLGLSKQPTEGNDRLPFLFEDLNATREVFGVGWPKDFDLDMVATELGEDYPANVVS